MSKGYWFTWLNHGRLILITYKMINKCLLCKKYPRVNQFFCRDCLNEKTRHKTFEQRIQIICKLGLIKGHIGSGKCSVKAEDMLNERK